MLCKTKQEYLRELTRELRGYFKRKDVKNIILDYEDFFSAGISEGKSEAEICGEFGDVKNLAREIAENQTDARRMISLEKYLIVGALALAVVLLYWIVDYDTLMLSSWLSNIIYTNRRGNFGVFMLIIFFLTPVFILLFIRFYKKYEIEWNEKILFILVCLPVIWDLKDISLFSATFFIGDIFTPNTALGEFSILINILFFIEGILFLITALVIFLALRKEKLDYIALMPIIFILTGLYQTLNYIMSILGSMADLEKTLRYFAESLLPLALGLGFAALIYIFAFWRKYLRKFIKQGREGQ